jgi:hypothetical protein
VWISKKEHKEAHYRSVMEHVQIRAKQRYNLDVKPELLQRLIERIENNKALFVEDNFDNTGEWLVPCDHESNCTVVRVLYDYERKVILTFLPWKRGHWKQWSEFRKEKERNKVLEAQRHSGSAIPECIDDPQPHLDAAQRN